MKRGAYAIVVVAKDSPNKLIGARKGSPMGGIGDGEYFIASDASPIIEYTKDVTYLNDGEIAFIEDGKLTIKTIDNIERLLYNDSK